LRELHPRLKAVLGLLEKLKIKKVVIIIIFNDKKKMPFEKNVLQV